MKKTPKLRFKEFSGDWESKKLGSICDVTMGQSPSSSCYNEENIGLPLIQGNADVLARKTSPRVYTSDITKTCDIGDIIMSVRAPVGAISKSMHNACIGRGVCSIKPKQNSEFIYQFLVKYEDKWSRISQGSTFESVNRTDIIDTKVFVPSKDEQEKIASFFTLIDDKISLQGEKVEAFKDYKKGMMQKIFSKELRFKDDDGRDYPEWKEGKVKDVITEHLYPIDKPSNSYWRLGLRSHGKGTFHEFVTDPSKVSMDKLYVVKKNMLIVNITFAWEHAIAITDTLDEGKLVSHRFPTYDFNENAVYDFYKYYILLPKFKYCLLNASPGGAGRNRVLNKKQFLEIDVPIPCIEEQKKISKILNQLDIKINKEQKKLDYLNEYKKGLLQQMFV